MRRLRGAASLSCALSLLGAREGFFHRIDDVGLFAVLAAAALLTDFGLASTPLRRRLALALAVSAGAFLSWDTLGATGMAPLGAFFVGLTCAMLGLGFQTAEAVEAPA